MNLGLNLAVLDNRIVADMNVYKRRTTDLLFKDQAIPQSTGFSSISYINAGTMDNQGIEVNLNTNNLIKVGKWTFDFNGNISNCRNKIISLDPTVLDGYNADFSYSNGSYLSRVQEGNAFGSIYGFRYKGVYQYDKYVARPRRHLPRGERR